MAGKSSSSNLQNSSPITVMAQYIKDLSFEVPGAPQIYPLLAKQQPEIDVAIDLLTDKTEDNQYEVNLKLNVTATLETKHAFILELIYSGLFLINVPEEHQKPVLMIECPRLLFPFARQIIANITSEACLPPLVIQPVDFVTLYQKRLHKESASNS